MGNLSTPPVDKARRPGRLAAFLAFAVVLLSFLIYGLQVAAHVLTVPWYVPIAGTAALLLMVRSLLLARTRWRVVGTVVLALLAGGEWYGLVWRSRLEPYDGPVKVGEPFPAFTTERADGTPFTQDDLKGGQNTAMVFFRGRG